MSDSGSPRFQVWSWKWPSECRSRFAEDWADIRVLLHRLELHLDTRPRAGIALAEDSAGTTAVADGDHELRVRRGRVSTPKSHLHILGDGSRESKCKVGVPRTRDKPDAQAFDVVERIIERMDLQLATVTRPGVDGSNTQRAAENFENARLQCRRQHAATSSPGGGGSVTIPTRPIWRSVFNMAINRARYKTG